MHPPLPRERAPPFLIIDVGELWVATSGCQRWWETSGLDSILHKEPLSDNTLSFGRNSSAHLRSYYVARRQDEKERKVAVTGNAGARLTPDMGDDQYKCRLTSASSLRYHGMQTWRIRFERSPSMVGRGPSSLPDPGLGSLGPGHTEEAPMAIGDAVVVERAWVLFRLEKRVLIVPLTPNSGIYRWARCLTRMTEPHDLPVAF
ncbi:hypothetical protein FPV67DRAFT_1451653 [Lyophyllum atratum]|nr:hypothetical protein FPV67DRAFT_1451653 [Lyophyllum atratum]